MGIGMYSLVLDNVLTYEVEQKKDDWQNGVYEMENFTLNKDVYKNGPVIFSCKQHTTDKNAGLFTYYLPISSSVVLSDESVFTFKETFVLEKALLLRQADQEIDFYAAYEKVISYANSNKIEVEDTYYCVLLEVYGEYMIDLYVPLKEQGDE